jgi:hypothetical protein
MTNWKKLNLLICGFLLAIFANAQQFHYRSNLDTVNASGFYAISITPEVSSRLKTDFSDFRVVDTKGRWVPHIIRFADAGNKSPNTVNLRMSINEEQDSITVVLIENPEKYLLSEFILRLKNAAADRIASLSGSDDNKTWYAISDRLMVTSGGSYNRDENSQSIPVPPTKYSYYKLTIRNLHRDPLNILGISSTISVVHNGEFQVIQNPIPVFSQVDSGKLTMIKVTYDIPYQIDQLKPVVIRPILYARPAKVYLEMKPGLINMWESPSLSEFMLTSNNLGNYAIPLVKAKTFYILISNEDNPPLEINAVNTFQRSMEAITYLENGKSYHLLLENPQAEQPRYDLAQFDKSIPERPRVLRIGELMAVSVPAIATSRKVGDWWIWTTIGGVILVLAYLTWGLARDMNKKKEIV